MKNQALKIEIPRDTANVVPAQVPAKIQEFLTKNAPQSPCLIVDMDIVAGNFQKLRQLLPYATCHYAVKANPAQPIMDYLVSQNSHFDAASINEINLCLATGAKPEQILFGNTIKKRDEIVEAYKKGIRLYACDSFQELDKLSELAPGAQIFARIRTSGIGAAWPLSKKFGCKPDMAVELLEEAARKGLVPYGVSFHVGSQQTLTSAYDESIESASHIFKQLKLKGIELKAVDLGGGFPSQYRSPVAPIEDYAAAITESLEKHFGDYFAGLTVIIEPGRYISASAGVLQAEVVLVSHSREEGNRRWIYLDVGKYNGLAETEAIQYSIITDYDGEEETGRVVIAGPTCDSTDIVYEKAEYYLPLSLKSGDKMLFLGTGAYTTTYASVAFNGFSPLKDYYI